MYFQKIKFNIGCGEYLGLPAVLSEELDRLGEPVEVSTKMFIDQFDEKEIWLLGASYNTTRKFEAKNTVKCSDDSCYAKSLDENKICKPGTLFFQGKTYSDIVFFYFQSKTVTSYQVF